MSGYFYRRFMKILAVTILFTSIPFYAVAEQPPDDPWNGYIMDSEKGLCLEIHDYDFALALSELNGAPRGHVDLYKLPEKLTLAKTPSKEKRTGPRMLYNLSGWSYTKGKTVEGQYAFELRPNELKINGKAYTISQKQYDSLKKAAAAVENKSRGSEYPAFYSPLWTTWTLVSDVVKLEIRDKDMRYPEKEVGKYRDNVNLLYECLNFLVTPDTKMYKTGSRYGKIPNALEAKMTLKSGRKLSVIINGETLYVEMSDRDYGYEYKLRDGGKHTQKTVRELLKKQ